MVLRCGVDAGGDITSRNQRMALVGPWIIMSALPMAPGSRSRVNTLEDQPADKKVVSVLLRLLLGDDLLHAVPLMPHVAHGVL